MATVFNAHDMVHPKSTDSTFAENDSDSTEEGSTGSLSVVRKLVEIPREQGMANISSILEQDMLNRYQAKKSELNFVLQSERAFAKIVGMKYALSLNSGGIAISLGLEAMKRVLFPEIAIDQIRVYSNAFTFHAVPSACVVAGFGETLKLIEATEELVVDLDHLEQCIQEDLASGKFTRGNMILVLSYMRGRVPDMHKVMQLCDKYAVQLLEDSAHGYGCSFDGKMCGSFGVVSTISTQANKLVNTGEGGMVFTNNDEMQAFFIFSAGSYEELWRKHEEMTPPEDVCLNYKYTVVNKSTRMTNLQAALMVPQLDVMQQRIDHHNAMYYYLTGQTAAKLEELCGVGTSRRVFFMPQSHELVGPVYDSLQIRIMTEAGCLAQEEFPALDAFLKLMQGRKYSIAKFSDPANARNYLSWQYLKSEDIMPCMLPKTARNLINVCDLRMLCHDTEQEMDKLAMDIAECFQSTLAK
jgi:dTDP-4-amino-4,6-dideoxygalactose transaminase